MSSKAIGDNAESVVCDYLEKQGYKIVDRNWRTRWCEIDIVAKKAKTVHFVEVKYRHTSDFGGGFDYITPAKLRQMRFAAELWISSNRYTGDVCLSAAAVGSDGIVNFIESITS